MSDSEGEQPPAAAPQARAAPTVTPTVTSSSFTPVKPKFGGLVKVSDTTTEAWVGGEPLHDWSGLKDPKPTQVSAMQYRPSSVYAQQKTQPFRRAGLKDKFSKGDDLLVFQRKIWKHLKEHGLDTPTYIEDPSAYGQLVSVVSDHGKFTYEDGKAKAKFNLKYFDEYMHSCSKDAIEVLLDSVDDKIHKQLYQSCTDKDPFVTYWLRFIKVINITSTGEFKAMEAKMLERKITDYEGENVEALCTDYFNTSLFVCYFPNL